MHPLKTNRDVRKFKWQYKVRNMPEKLLPAIVADGAAWEKITKRRAGIRWDGVVEKGWKELEGKTKKRGTTTACYREFLRVQGRSKRKTRRKGRASLAPINNVQ